MIKYFTSKKKKLCEQYNRKKEKKYNRSIQV